MAVDEISSVPVTMPDQSIEWASQPPPEQPSDEPLPQEEITDESVGQNVDVTA